ncbi:MAG: YcaQ family DNA glycosylase, partial [Polyangiaceae bacterium]|nr:YcaQ family DNA glycosylase [Polyangiaceae bacterium]
LVLAARIDGHERSACDALLYGPPGERRLFEAYNKSLNILPVEDLPYHRVAWAHARARYRTTVLRTHARAVRAILRALAARGPLSSAEVSDSADHLGARVDWWWGPTRTGRALLEALYTTGRVGIARREGNTRWYDLTERLYPPELLAGRVTGSRALRHRLLSRHRGVGLLGGTGATELFVGTGTADERSRALARLVRDGALVPVEVEGVKGQRHVLADELELVRETEAPDRPETRRVALVAPLDPLLWDRRLLRELFDFDYVWEVYTPMHRRRHGYYVLPILYGDRLVGRLEPRMVRATGTLEVAGLWLEPSFDPSTEPGFAPALDDALEAHRRLAAAERVAWPRGKPPWLAASAGCEPALGRAKLRAWAPHRPSGRPRTGRTASS